MRTGTYKDGRKVKVYLHEYCDRSEPDEFEIVFENGERKFESNESNITYD